MKPIARFWPNTNTSERAFLFLRWLWTPYKKIASLLPMEGNILDLGCGHGLFALAAAEQSLQRTVSALDHDSHRIEIAKSAASGIQNLSFHCGTITDSQWKAGLSGIAMIDVLHYFDYSTQETLFKKAQECLSPDGVLVFREVDHRPSFFSIFNRLYERLMLLIGFTQATSLHFRSVPGWIQTAKKFGFQVTSEKCGRFPFEDWLFVCTKKKTVS